MIAIVQLSLPSAKPVLKRVGDLANVLNVGLPEECVVLVISVECLHRLVGLYRVGEKKKKLVNSSRQILECTAEHAAYAAEHALRAAEHALRAAHHTTNEYQCRKVS